MATYKISETGQLLASCSQRGYDEVQTQKNTYDITARTYGPRAQNNAKIIISKIEKFKTNSNYPLKSPKTIAIAPHSTFRLSKPMMATWF